MFIRSRMNIPVTYRKGGFNIVLNPNTVTYVDETKVSGAELKGLYGDRIDVINGEGGVNVPPVKAEEKKEVESNIISVLSLDETLIDDIVNQLGDGEAPVAPETVEVPTEAPTPEPTEEPTPEPTPEPTEEPTPEPTPEPTEAPKPAKKPAGGKKGGKNKNK